MLFVRLEKLKAGKEAKSWKPISLRISLMSKCEGKHRTFYTFILTEWN